MVEPLRILMVEDLATDAELEERALRDAGLTFVLRRVERRTDFVAALAGFRPDVVICDYRLPDFDGMDALALAGEFAPGTPVIVVTGSINEETAAACIKAGAMDYVLKGHLGRLAPAVRTALDRKRLADEAQRAREALEASERRYRAIFHDARDGIFIADPLTHVIQEANRSAVEMAGFTTDQMSGQSLLRLVAPEDLEQVRRAWELTVRGGAAGPLEMGLLRPDGTVLPVEARASAFQDADGTQRIVGILRDISRRRREESALRASEARFRALFEHARDGIVLVDSETMTVVDVNPSGLAIAGRPLEEVRDQPVTALIATEGLRNLDAQRAVATGGGDTTALELDVVRPDGTRVRVDVRGSTFVDRDGRRRFVGIIRDETQRARAAAALRESEERFRHVVEGAPDGVFVQTDGQFAYLNPTATALFGATTPDDLLGRPVMERVHPDFRAVVAGRVRVIDEDRSPVPLLEEIYLRLDGSPFDVEVSAIPFEYEGRRGAVVFFRDITARRQAEAQLAMLGAALEQAAEVAVVTDLDAVIQYVNPAFERITGYTRAEAVGQNPRILKSGVQGPEIYRRFWDTLTAGDTFSDTFVNRKKNGEHYIAEVVISPVRDGSGRTVKYLALQRDVTREHDLEDQLRQAQKMEALGQLTGGLAHDFNNLLSVILSNAALLKSELPPERAELSGYVTDLNEAAQQGAAMVKKLLGFSRRETLSLVPTDIGLALGDFEGTARRLIPESIAIRVQAPRGLVAVADAGALQQILLNLATNARDAMPDGGTITVSARSVEFRVEDDPLLQGVDRPGPYVCIAVTDVGVGMNQATLARVFEPFFTTKAPGAGTGLGLPMVYGLMKQHGGFARLYSEPGHGTTVRLYFPATSAPGTGRRPSQETGAVRGTETILVVEDQEMLRRATARALTKLGYTVLVAADGEEGLAMLREKAGEIAMVLSDVVMPTMGGVVMVQRAREAGIGVRFLLMSGYAADSGAGSPPEGIPLLEKPWTIDALSRNVRAVLDGPPQT